MQSTMRHAWSAIFAALWLPAILRAGSAGGYLSLHELCANGQMGDLCSDCPKFDGYFKIKDGSPNKCYKLIGQRDNTPDSYPLTSDGFYVDNEFFVNRDVAIGLCNAESAKLPGAENRDTIVAIENLLNEYSEKQGLFRQFPGESLNGDPGNGIWLRYERLPYDFDMTLLQEEFPHGLSWNDLETLDSSSHWVEIHNLRTNRSNYYDLYDSTVRMNNILFRPFRNVVDGVAVFNKKNGPAPPDDQPRDDAWYKGRNELATAIKSIGRKNPYSTMPGKFDYGVDDYDPTNKHAVLCERGLEPSTCAAGGNFQCATGGETVDCKLVCASRFSYCADGSDQAGCDYFHCNNGDVVPWWQFCDFGQKCIDGSDEPETCPPQFICDNGINIPRYYACDRYFDCDSDDSDEQGCLECATTRRWVHPQFLHDGIDDCGDGSDEL
jgi:hypothetical protein